MTPRILLPRRPALYIHVPYCAGKCAYCSFHSLPVDPPGGAVPSEMVTAVLARAGVLSDRFEASPFSTAYVGGGTPTVLAPEDLGRLLEGISRLGGAAGFEEWTVEANPESLSEETLGIFSRSGVDRISLGMQSGQPEALRAAGRFADPEAGGRALELLASRWRGRLSVDLMIGLPGQSPEGVREDIARAVSSGAEHLSLYALTVEEGTPLAERVRRGEASLPSDGADAELWSAASEACASAGLARYEVSNWARPGAECRHNRNYWDGGAWVGAGPSAVSSFPTSDGGTVRMQETLDHEAYLRDPEAAAEEEIVRPDVAAFEAVMTAFRTREGIDAEAFRARFGVPPESLFPGAFAKWREYLEAGPRGPAPSDRLLDILNPFLLDCMEDLAAGAGGRDVGGTG